MLDNVVNREIELVDEENPWTLKQAFNGFHASTDDEIWNQKSDILLMAKRVGNGLVLEKRERFYEGLKIGPDRTEMNIWFGKNSSTDVYTNP